MARARKGVHAITLVEMDARAERQLSTLQTNSANHTSSSKVYLIEKELFHQVKAD